MDKKTKRKDSRHSFPLKLCPHKDADLIDLITAIPRGERQGAIRDLLRAGAGLEKRDRMDEVIRALARLEQRLKDIRVVAPAAVPESEPVGISETEAERRKAQLKKARW
ncbi:MAG: hypothetical protein IT322_20745 [Anaerolineae bacterium]|nr:hypothetical protein [Anaerolineae bacterium]